MSFQQFLGEFARVQGVGSASALLEDHADRYSFQIKSRERARKFIETLETSADFQPKGRNVLDVGCAYGSFAIELALRGARVTGIDISQKWLSLAEVNAAGEVDDVTFLNCDASSRKALKELSPHGPFDTVILNDVFEHIYDTAGLLRNITQLMTPDGIIYFKVPNGLATRHVLMEGHKKVFGISLLPPDYWHLYVKAPFHIYYRRWEYFAALFDHFGLTQTHDMNPVTDQGIDITRRHIRNDMKRIRTLLKRENFKDAAQFAHVRRALAYYFEEVEEDLETMSFEELFRKYRVTFWESILKKRT